MPENVKAIPEGYEGVTPYLICKNAEVDRFLYKSFWSKRIVQNRRTRNGRPCGIEDRKRDNYARG